MFSVPLTYTFDFKCANDIMRPDIMHEFAVNGAKHLVMNDMLLKKDDLEHGIFYKKSIIRDL